MTRLGHTRLARALRRILGAILVFSAPGSSSADDGNAGNGGEGTGIARG